MRKLPPPPRNACDTICPPSDPVQWNFTPSPLAFTFCLSLYRLALLFCPPLIFPSTGNLPPICIIHFLFYQSLLLHFTKLAVSPLIMVRFEKFKIWHAQHFDANLLRVRDATCDVPRARDVTRDVINATISLLPLVVKHLLGRGYL